VKSLDVLVTAASRRVPLVEGFRSALAALGVRGRVLVTDVNPLSPAVHVADGWFQVPLANHPDYLDTLLTICEAEGIGLLVPTIDDEVELLGRSVPMFSRLRTKVAVSAEATSRLCNDKFALCTHLRAHGIAAAATFLPDQLPAAPSFPLFVKPRNGRGGVGAFAIRNGRHLEFFLEYVATPIVQEYLHGPEFTIDVLCDFSGCPLAIVPRERVVIRAGVIDRGRTVRDERLIVLAQSIVKLIPFAGPLNIQCRMVAGRPVVFEINPRFSGGIPLTIAAGADFPRMLAELALDRRIQPAIGAFRDGLWMTNYESSVFLDATMLDSNRLLKPLSVGDVA
jgi:carbamoyl-phosphate synthase large subunit